MQRGCCGPTTPGEPCPPRFGLFPVRSPLLGESLLFSFPAGTKMFQFPALASVTNILRMTGLCRPGCPIRKPRGQGPFAPNPGLSQLTASFIASESQGIRRAPFNASYAWVSTSHKGGESRIPQLFHLSSDHTLPSGRYGLRLLLSLSLIFQFAKT